MYVILGIGSMGIFGSYPLIICSIFAFLVIYMLIKRKIVFPNTKNFYIITLFSILYTFFNYTNKNTSTLYLMFTIPMSYYSGIIINKFCHSDEKYIFKCVMSILIGFFIHAMLNLFTNIGSSNRNLLDFWIKINWAATLQATLITMYISILFWVIIYEKNIRKKVFYLIGFILSLLFITTIASRTPLIVIILVFIIMLIIDNILNKKGTHNNKIFLLVFMTIAFSYIICSINIGGIKDKIESSNLFQRFSLVETQKSDDNRVETLFLGIKSIIENPTGNKENIGNLKYAHNLWLDVGKMSGIIPFIILIVYTANTFISLLKLFKIERISTSYKMFISSIYIGVNINFFSEPILQGVPLFFMMFVTINAMIDSQIVKLKEDKSMNYD